MTPDHINGAFEGFGAAFSLLNVRRLRKDGNVRGTSLWAAGFFAAWGLWNLFYYPSLGQWWSFYGGLALALSNCAWMALALIYWRHDKQFAPPCLNSKAYFTVSKAPSPMSSALAMLIEEARYFRPTPEQAEATRRSFAYGNAKLSNPAITREMVDKAAEKMTPGIGLPPSCSSPRHCPNPACMVTGHCQEMMLGRMGL